VTVTASGDLDPAARFFTAGDGERLVYCPDSVAGRLRARVRDAAVVVPAGEPVALGDVLDDLAARGVRRLLVEGGTALNTRLLAGDLVDELQLAVAPFLVGEPGAPHLVADARFPHDARHPMTLAEARTIGQVVLLRYVLSERARDRHWLRAAVELSRRCPPSPGAYSVGAVVVSADGEVLAEGWSRDTDPQVHAEESALSRVARADPRLRSATLYSSLEPCSRRRSRPVTCTRHILAAGIRRVVFALREPDLFVRCTGAEELRDAGVTVVELPELAAEARAANGHLPLSEPG
jgi:5-amino-6-(5-phosphoribosylamino)uracil reductase